MRVARVLERVIAERGGDRDGQRAGADEPRVDQWAYSRGVWLFFIDSGKRLRNCNGTLRHECLNPLVLALNDAREIVDTWQRDSQRRPATHVAEEADAAGVR